MKKLMISVATLIALVISPAAAADKPGSHATCTYGEGIYGPITLEAEGLPNNSKTKYITITSVATGALVDGPIWYGSAVTDGEIYLALGPYSEPVTFTFLGTTAVCTSV